MLETDLNLLMNVIEAFIDSNLTGDNKIIIGKLQSTVLQQLFEV